MQNPGRYLLQHFSATLGRACLYCKQQPQPTDEKTKRGNHLDDGPHARSQCIRYERGPAHGRASAGVLDADGGVSDARMASNALLAAQKLVGFNDVSCEIPFVPSNNFPNLSP